MRCPLLIALFLAPAAISAEPPPRNDGASWTTLHGDLQRSGFYPALNEPPYRLVWRKELWQELTGPRAEVIVANGLAFLGSYAGKLRAWDVESGEERWSILTGGPILHSPAIAGGKLYVASMDRTLRAIEPSSGRELWRFEASEGFSTSPCVWKDSVLLGDRAGVFHSVDATTGTERWRYSTGGPILTSASISSDGGAALFAAEDMHVYCLRIDDGTLLWKSRKLAGVSVRDYAPTVVNDLLIVATAPVKDFHTTLGEHEQMLVRRTGFKGKDARFLAGADADVSAEQDDIVAFLKSHPDEQTFYAFRVSDGSEPWIAPILYAGGMHNPATPPCYSPVTGEVFVQLRTAYGLWDGGGEVRAYTGFGRLNLETGRVALLNPSDPSKEPGRAAGAKDREHATFNYIGDETQTLSCAPGWLFSNHQGFFGGLDLNTLRTKRMWGKRDTYGGFYGPGNFGWEDKGGYEKAAAAGQPFAVVNEWHGPARSVVSVAGDRLFFHTGSQVLCLESETKQTAKGKP